MLLKWALQKYEKNSIAFAQVLQQRLQMTQDNFAIMQTCKKVWDREKDNATSQNTDT